MFLAGLLLFVMLVNSCGTVIYTSSGIYKSYSMVESIIEPINKARTTGIMCGNKYYKAVDPVVWNEKLAEASLQHSRDMAENGFLSHKGSDGSDPGERLLRVGYRWVLYGEDIGQGYQATDEAVRSWLKSKMHCKNIMNPEFKEAGASYARSSNLRAYWTLVLGTPSK